jgi:hypothetical protein
MSEVRPQAKPGERTRSSKRIEMSSASKWMCRLLGIACAGYYTWLDHPVFDRAQEDARLLRLIRTSFIASHGIYGAP